VRGREEERKGGGGREGRGFEIEQASQLPLPPLGHAVHVFLPPFPPSLFPTTTYFRSFSVSLVSREEEEEPAWDVGGRGGGMSFGGLRLRRLVFSQEGGKEGESKGGRE